MTGRMRGKVVLVMGAGSPDGEVSNGLAASVIYAREGATVICADRDEGLAGVTVTAVRDGGGTASPHQVDVTQEEQVRACVAAVIETHGRVDVLHNNVGMTRLGGPAELEYDDWRQTLAVNLDSVFLTCKYVLPAMREAGSGSIINISSVAALRDVGYDYPAYMAAKAAVNQLTVSIALQNADRGIRANSVAPGLIDTPLVRAQLHSQAASIDELLAVRHAASPTGRMGTPWDVAHASVFLASDEAAYVNGVCLPVDGGLTCRAV